MASKHRSLTGYMKQRGNDAVNPLHEEPNITSLQRQAIKQDSEEALRRKREEEVEEAEKPQRDQQDTKRSNWLPTNRGYDPCAFESKARTIAITPRQRRGDGLRVQPPKTILERDNSMNNKNDSAPRDTSMAPVTSSTGIEISRTKQEYSQGRPFYETDTDHIDDTTTLSHDGDSKETKSLEYNSESTHRFPPRSHQGWEDTAPQHPQKDFLNSQSFPQPKHAQFYSPPPASSSHPDEEDGEEYNEGTDERTEEGETDDEGSSEGLPAEDDPTLDTTTLQAMQREAELARQAHEKHVTYQISPSMQMSPSMKSSPSPMGLPMRTSTNPHPQASLSPRETIRVPSPLHSDALSTPQAAQPATKRPVSLDYTPAELANIPYATLASESFDYNPQALPTHPHTPPVPAATSLAEGLLHLSSHFISSIERHTFFSSLPIADYEEAGDLLLSRFSETIQKFKTARRERRRIAGEFEEEVARREERVRGRVGGIEKEVGRLRRAGEDVVRGKAT